MPTSLENQVTYAVGRLQEGGRSNADIAKGLNILSDFSSFDAGQVNTYLGTRDVSPYSQELMQELLTPLCDMATDDPTQVDDDMFLLGTIRNTLRTRANQLGASRAAGDTGVNPFEFEEVDKKPKKIGGGGGIKGKVDRMRGKYDPDAAGLLSDLKQEEGEAYKRHRLAYIDQHGTAPNHAAEKSKGYALKGFAVGAALGIISLIAGIATGGIGFLVMALITPLVITTAAGSYGYYSGNKQDHKAHKSFEAAGKFKTHKMEREKELQNNLPGAKLLDAEDVRKTTRTWAETSQDVSDIAPGRQREKHTDRAKRGTNNTTGRGAT